ncbi:MAG TPA: pantoate--beta-alanine ligase [Steroidobacteraceae bacterium]|jgi:pantoate--beta-alanine ligase|nr:pantoate--beta-alanine ligase [Steroidobacteraceae bacterium]
METLTRSASVRDRVRAWRAAGQRIALVPTRGSLHKGHMRLVAEAQERAERVIVSTFCDPPQRDAPTLEADRELLMNIGADLLFVPPVQEMFPAGREGSAVVSLPGLQDVLEGALKPGYFAAAATILIKLFNIVRPDIAMFGERHYQQLIIVRRLVDELFFSIDIVGCPPFRDNDGLAFAPGNRDIPDGDRGVAPRLYATLTAIGAKIDAGERDYDSLERLGASWLEEAGFVTEYFAIRQAADLAAVRAGTRDLVILAAARLQRVRLTDNLRVHLIDRH